MYDSPIKLIDRIVNQFTEQINEATDESIYKAVLEVGVHVDKDELIKALRYDRGQYERGFLDGMFSVQNEGEWIYHGCVSSYDGTKSGYSCSKCSAFVDEEVFDTDGFHKKHCGNCGAKMKGGEG